MDGLLLGKYEILRILGRGGTGTVYEAREVGSGRPVAIKWMHERPFSEQDPDFQRFAQEARIAGRLDSPHVTAVHELAREPEKDVVFLVMELLRGEDLRALLERVGPLAPDVALRVAAQACSGLAAAHAAGVVHRDVKPENLFLARTGDGQITVKLLDFGLAKIRLAHGTSSAAAAPGAPMTESGDILGTPHYMAPEQIEGAKHADARCDVYSMGVTLYAMLAGAPPHLEVKSLAQLVRKLTTEPVPSLVERAPWVRPEVAAIVGKAMSGDREARYPDGAALAAALAPLLPGGASLREEALEGLSEEERRAPAREAESIPPAGERAEGSREIAAEGAEGAASVPAGRPSRAARWPLALLLLALAAIVAGVLSALR